MTRASARAELRRGSGELSEQLRGGGKGDGVAEFLELGDEAAGLAFGIAATLEVVDAKVLELLAGAVVGSLSAVVDTAGQPVDGATVTLNRADDLNGPFTPVPDGSDLMSPENRVNPAVTDGTGLFKWDVIAGWYQLTASKPGCTSVSGEPSASTFPLQIAPPALNLRLVLDCRPPDPAAPVISVSGAPPALINQTEVAVQVTVTDASPAAAVCLVDDAYTIDEDGEAQGDLAGCGDTFTMTGLSDGPHRLAVLAFDDRNNASVEVVEFTVDATGPDIIIGGSPTARPTRQARCPHRHAPRPTRSPGSPGHAPGSRRAHPAGSACGPTPPKQPTSRATPRHAP